MIELAEGLRKIEYTPSETMDNANEKFLEGSYMHKHGGIYYY